MKRTVSQIVTPSDAHGGPLWLPLGNDKAPHGLHLNRAKFPTKRVWQLRSMRWTVRAEIHELHLPHLPVVVNVHIVHRTSFIILPRSWYVRKQKEELHNQLKCCQWHKFQKVTQNAMRTKKRRSFCILRDLLTGAPPETTCCPKQGVGAMMISGSNIPSFGDQHLQCLQITIPGSTSGHSQIPDFTQ